MEHRELLATVEEHAAIFSPLRWSGILLFALVVTGYALLVRLSSSNRVRDRLQETKDRMLRQGSALQWVRQKSAECPIVRSRSLVGLPILLEDIAETEESFEIESNGTPSHVHIQDVRSTSFRIDFGYDPTFQVGERQKVVSFCSLADSGRVDEEGDFGSLPSV